VRRALTGRMRRLEATVPVRCGGCGRIGSADQATSSLLLYRFEGRLMRGDGRHVRDEDLRPCRECGQPKERCGKVIVGIDPVALVGGL
jgi:hypothetical protein